MYKDPADAFPAATKTRWPSGVMAAAVIGTPNPLTGVWMELPLLSTTVTLELATTKNRVPAGLERIVKAPEGAAKEPAGVKVSVAKALTVELAPGRSSTRCAFTGSANSEATSAAHAYTFLTAMITS
jgi:hypothetical protein